VNFYYDHATHWVTSDAQGPIITAPGSFQSELGCPGDWMPGCMRPWLQDPDGDGTYTWSTDQIPVGSYEFKVAHALKWDESYGDSGGNNVALSVPSAGSVVTISYVLATHQISVKNSKAGATPDLVKSKAFWVSKDIVAWPATAVPSGANLALLSWRLHWSPTGGLAVDAESVTGGLCCRPHLRLGWAAGKRRGCPSRAQGLPGAAVEQEDCGASRLESCRVRSLLPCMTILAVCSMRPVCRYRVSWTTSTVWRLRAPMG